LFFSSQEIFSVGRATRVCIFKGVVPLSRPAFQNASSGDTVDGERFLETTLASIVPEDRKDLDGGWKREKVAENSYLFEGLCLIRKHPSHSAPCESAVRKGASHIAYRKNSGQQAAGSEQKAEESSKAAPKGRQKLNKMRCHQSWTSAAPSGL
jgi:hypothetical protein